MREDRNNGFNEGNTYLFSYDSRGNLTSNSTLRYVNPESSTDSIRKDYTTDFTLDNEIWADAITEINTASKFIYDESGNPLSFDSIHFDWSEGRMLKSVEYSEDGMSLIDCRFTYNEKGIRTSKTVFGKTTYYTTDEGIITSQYQLDDEGNVIEEMIFLYDSSDNAIGFVYNGDLYFYTKNHLGDVLGITDSSGTWIARYYYNAWGRQIYTKVNSEFENDVQKLAAADYNPLRYRSYMYDGWFDIYYLQSRYYNSEWGKFLNADLPEYAKQQKDDHAGTNLFAYCCNDPVNNVDPEGYNPNSNFKTSDKAALDFAKKTYGISLYIRFELCALIYQYKKNGRIYYGYTGYAFGEPHTCDPVKQCKYYSKPKNAKIVATIHTHPNATLGGLSDDDFKYANHYKKNTYVVSKKGIYFHNYKKKFDQKRVYKYFVYNIVSKKDKIALKNMFKEKWNKHIKKRCDFNCAKKVWPAKNV